MFLHTAGAKNVTWGKTWGFYFRGLQKCENLRGIATKPIEKQLPHSSHRCSPPPYSRVNINISPLHSQAGNARIGTRLFDASDKPVSWLGLYHALMFYPF